MPWPLFLAPRGPSSSLVAVPTWACFILDCKHAGQGETAPAGRRAHAFCSKSCKLMPSEPALFPLCSTLASVPGCKVG